MVFQLDARIPLGFTGGYDPAVGQRNQLMRLQRDALESEVGETNALRDVLRQYGPALNADDLTQRQAAAAAVAAVGPRGYALAAPVMTGIRNRRELDAIMGGGAAPAAPSGGVRAEPLAPVGDPLARIAAVESGGNDAARNPRSSASGRFQITDGTWRQYAPRLGLADGDRLNPQAQEAVARAIQRDAVAAVGRDLSPAEAYGAHFLGIGGLRAFLGADPNADAQTVYAQAAGPRVAEQAFRTNPGLLEPGMTVGQVMGALERRMGSGGAPAGGAAMPVSAPGAAPSGAPRMPGQPTPQQFAGLMQAAANGNEQAQRLVQVWAPFMRQETRQPPAPVRLGDGPAGPAGMYIPDASAPGGYRRIADAPASAPQVVIQGDTVRGRADAATLQDVQRGANDARQLITLFDRAERAVNRVPEGQGAQLLPVIGQAARALGIEIDGTSEAEVLRSITNGLAVLQRAPGSGATTDFEMRLYMQAVPRLGNTRQGNLMLIDMGRRLAQRRLAEADIWRRHAGEPDLMERLNALPPVFSPEEINVLEQDATPTSAPVPGAPQATVGGRPVEPPAPAATPRRARNAQGQVIEWNGSAWVPVQ